jgi:hypothetical protein
MTRTTPSRWISLHLSQIFLTDARTFIKLTDLLQNPSPRQIVLPELDFHAVARQQPEPIPYRRSGSVGQNLRFVTQFEPVQQARQFFYYDRLDCHGLKPFTVSVLLSPPTPGFALTVWSKPTVR